MSTCSYYQWLRNNISLVSTAAASCDAARARTVAVKVKWALDGWRVLSTTLEKSGVWLAPLSDVKKLAYNSRLDASSSLTWYPKTIKLDLLCRSYACVSSSDSSCTYLLVSTVQPTGTRERERERERFGSDSCTFQQCWGQAERLPRLTFFHFSAPLLFGAWISAVC
jgi:hypothetical protein